MKNQSSADDSDVGCPICESGRSASSGNMSASPIFRPT